MLAFRNNSDKLVIVLHEIYGINEHINSVCKNLAEFGYDIVCPDLLDGKPAFDYSQEEEAYRYFLNFVGFEPSVKKTTFLLRQEEKNYKSVFLLGFSIGATIAWLCNGNNINCDGIIGYYGSRIRDYLEIDPKCPTLLLFPEEEKSFDTRAIQMELKKKDLVEVHILEGTHGFADPFSKNYHEKSSEQATQIVKDFLIKLD